METNKKQNKLPDSSQIPWHPAFIEALQMELEAYKDVLEFHPELQLTTEPLRIDCVVIKKTKEVKIKKNIGVIFRTWNILEYKSPDDYISIMDFYKVYGYACFYAYLKDVPISDITITFVESHYPRELIKHLKNERNFTVAKTSEGVYNVSGDIMPIQIIDSRKLSAEDNVWLKSLRNKLNYSDVERISLEITQQGKNARIDAYAYAIAYANSKIMEERYMTRKAPSNKKPEFEQFLERAGFIAKWKAEGKAEGDEKWQGVFADLKAENERLKAELEKRQ